MILWVIVALVVALVILQFLQDVYQMYIQRIPPGPFSLPLVGNMHLLNIKLPHLSMEKVAEKFGKIYSFRMGPMGRAVFLLDINHINKLFDSPFTHDRPDMPIFDKVNKGADGIGSCKFDGRWKVMTKALHKGLARITNTKVESICMHAFTQLYDRFAEAGMSKDNYSPRTDVITACSAMFSAIVYGIEPETLDSPELKTRIRYHSMIMSVLNPIHPFNLVPSLFSLPFPIKKKLFKCLEERDQLFIKSLNEHMEQNKGEAEDIIDVIAEFERNRDPSDESVTIQDMFLSSWTLYLAGCDTLTDTTLWILLYLSIYTDVQDKMAAEIDAVIVDDDQSILESKRMLHYTRAAILESIRLASPVAMGLPSQLTQDMHIDGYTIPKGMMVFPNQWHVHHNPEYWPEPFAFKPERFLDDKGELFSTFHIFQKMPFIPFSRGKRPCIGQYIALDILLICFTSMLRKFTIRLPPEFQPDLTGNVLFNLRPNDFPIQCHER